MNKLAGFGLLVIQMWIGLDPEKSALSEPARIQITPDLNGPNQSVAQFRFNKSIQIDSDHPNRFILHYVEIPIG